MRLLIFLFLIFATNVCVYAFEVPYNKKTERKYFLEKPTVIVAKKIGGNLGWMEFKVSAALSTDYKNSYRSFSLRPPN